MLQLGTEAGYLRMGKTLSKQDSVFSACGREPLGLAGHIWGLRWTDELGEATPL